METYPSTSYHAEKVNRSSESEDSTDRPSNHDEIPTDDQSFDEDKTMESLFSEDEDKKIDMMLDSRQDTGDDSVFDQFTMDDIVEIQNRTTDDEDLLPMKKIRSDSLAIAWLTITITQKANDDRLADFSQNTLDNFYVLGYLAGDGCHGTRHGTLSVVSESLMFLELASVVRKLKVQNPRFSMANAPLSKTAKIKMGNVRTTMMLWVYPNRDLEKQYRDLGLPSSRILRTNPDKIKDFFPDDKRMIMFFFGLLMSEGCVYSRLRYRDGSRVLQTLGICLTDKLLLEKLMEKINKLMDSQYLDVKKMAYMRVDNKRKEHYMDLWYLIVPKEVTTILLTIYESLTDDICEKARYAKRLLEAIPNEAQSLRLQGISWTATVARLEDQYKEFITGDNSSLRSTIISLAAKEPQNSVEIQLLIAYVQICQYRLLNSPPVDQKRLALKKEFHPQRARELKLRFRQWQLKNQELLSERSRRWFKNRTLDQKQKGKETAKRGEKNPKKVRASTERYRKSHMEDVKKTQKKCSRLVNQPAYERKSLATLLIGTDNRHIQKRCKLPERNSMM
ncbi:hypothetical protein INT44_000070 [Umbelopsis vinacea]|uniref:Uncharacterized protein n=1 Tax=Umbelopsis vinacea TaxID=44442 RepID=A0A8H7PHA2_9FUNG|nr:hypothetical protein INT44_000070 [Umbelopsis vinacea]